MTLYSNKIYSTFHLGLDSIDSDAALFSLTLPFMPSVLILPSTIQLVLGNPGSTHVNDTAEGQSPPPRSRLARQRNPGRDPPK